jgi:hypothetical protein
VIKGGEQKMDEDIIVTDDGTVIYIRSSWGDPRSE